MAKHVAAVIGVFLLATIGWVVLGANVDLRTRRSDRQLRAKVGQLWGEPLEQRAPQAFLLVPRAVTREVCEDRGREARTVTETVVERQPLALAASAVEVDLDLDQRRKGLLWYATYRVRFGGTFAFTVPEPSAGDFRAEVRFPSAGGIYDDFRLTLDGQAVPLVREGDDLAVVTARLGRPGEHVLGVSYMSHGLDRFSYSLGDGITEARDFRLAATTDFDGFDFPDGAMSPTAKERTAGGWRLTWQYANLISGSGIGVEMPKRLNPGPMAARISFFAPVSLGFFFFVVMVVSTLRDIRIHPFNYFLLACAFFAFHLLLAYLVDHISLHLAFVVAALVSVGLVVSYMRLVAGARFAFVEVASAQLVYLVGFSYAFFFEGFTGLTVTVGAVLTLLVVMQLTGRRQLGAS